MVVVQHSEGKARSNIRSILIGLTIVVFFGFLVFNGRNYSPRRKYSVQGATVETFQRWNSLNCQSVLQTNSMTNKNHNFERRFSMPKSPQSFPPQVFPYPKVFLESRETAEMKSLFLSPQYVIEVDESQDFDSFTYLSLQRFCQKHQVIQSEIENPDILIVHSIKISRSENHTLRHDYHAVNYRIDAGNLEAYLLTISETGEALIVANTELGVNHAMSTLSQLIYSIGTYAFPLYIADWPENDWRGITLYIIV